MPEAIRPANQIVNRVLRFTVGNLTRLRFRASYDAGVLDSVKPPYLLIGNHTCNWDPFLMSVPVKGPVHFIASDEYFRTPLLRYLLHLVGGIPKTKNISDLQPVRTMLTLKKAGAIIGIYPEGNRNWDGVTGPLFGSTAKLAKLLKVPVFAVETTGGTLSHPRWARFARTGRMHLEYRLLFTPDACRTLSEAEIFERMVSALAHDDHPATEKRYAKTAEPFRFRGRCLAERLELYLFQCPRCRRADTMVSRGDLLRCRECGMTAEYGEDGKLRQGDASAAASPVRFSLTRDWDRWQCGNLKAAIRNHMPFPYALPDSGADDPAGIGKASSSEAGLSGREPDGDAILLVNGDAQLQTGGKSGKLKHAGSGSLQLHSSRLVLLFPDSGTPALEWPLAEISGLNIQYNNRLEFYHHDILYRFSFPKHIVSVWKWHQALLYSMEERQPSG